MRRREYFALGGALLTAAVAGCSGEADEDPSGGTGNGNGGGNGGDVESEPEPEPEPEDEGPPDPIKTSYEGSGADVVDEISIERFGPTTFVMQHSGERNFSVELYDSNGEYVDLLANVIGPWGGANAVGVFPGEYAIDIGADGPWKISITQDPEYALDEVATSWPVEFDGSTDTVYGPIDFSEQRTLSVRAEGGQNNIIQILNAQGALADLALNEIGPVEGSTFVSIGGVGWVDVEMSGPFEIVIEE